MIHVRHDTLKVLSSIAFAVWSFFLEILQNKLLEVSKVSFNTTVPILLTSPRFSPLYSEMSSYVPNSVLVALYVYFPFDAHKYVIFDIFDPILLKYMGLLSI